MAALLFTPPVNPSQPIESAYGFRLSSFRMGDGYSQRSPDGLNSVDQDQSFAWENLTLAEADAIETFMLDTKGSAPFTVSFLTDTTAQFIVTGLRRVKVASAAFSITVDVKRVFDL